MKVLMQRIHDLASRLERPVHFMEVCGTHTMVAFRSGLRHLLPDNVKLTAGPGCPVCVTEPGYIDAAISLCRSSNQILATFGDLVRVPGTHSSLEQERAKGADVRVVYSPKDALELARQFPDREIVFLGVGFETTAPTVAWSILRADTDNIMNYSVLCAHKTMPHAMENLLKDAEVHIDGFICPGHVSVITGAAPYRPLCKRYRVPCVISGFEPWDMLQTIALLLQQKLDGRAELEIEYSRSVGEKGNCAAQQLMDEVFIECDTPWRGMGTIPRSGLAIRRNYGRFDAENIFGLEIKATPVPGGCRCGDVLRGVIVPMDCRLFGKACSPGHPVGPCMVSSEGVCSAYYKYELRAAA